MMKAPIHRRAFLTLLGAPAAAWPLAARAQQPQRMPVVGVFMTIAENDPEYQVHMAQFREGLQKLGWIEGLNVRLDYRRATPGALGESMQPAAKELIALQPDLILSQNTPTTAALLQQTRTIPIIFAGVSDPVGSGFVAGLPRPGGNVTGFINAESSLGGKWLELLKEIAPRVGRVAVLFNPQTAPNGGSYYLRVMEAAAPILGLSLTAAPVQTVTDIETVIAREGREPDGGMVAAPDAFLTVHRAEVALFAARYRLPAVYPYRYFTEVGGLVSYGNDVGDNYRRAAIYADRILKGIKPSELPVQAPVKFELVVNAKTAKALGLEIPPSFYWRADEVIE